MSNISIILFEPKVKLKYFTDNPLGKIIEAIRITRDSFEKSDSIFDFESGALITLGPNDEKLIKKCIDLGHTSVLEFVDFIFELEISRVAQLQLVRHRISSFEAESARFVKPKSFLLPLEEDKMTNPEIKKIYEEIYEMELKYYNKLLELGVSKEDARYILGTGHVSKILYKSNLRSLRNAVSLRTCKKAEREIRIVFEKIYNLAFKIHPILMYNVKNCPKCIEKCQKNDQ